MENLNKLKNEVEKKLRLTEGRTSTIKGVKNLSVSDLETILMYIETIQNTGGINGLMSPRGNIEEVFNKYGVEFENTFYFTNVIFK